MSEVKAKSERTRNMVLGVSALAVGIYGASETVRNAIDKINPFTDDTTADTTTDVTTSDTTDTSGA